jgi:hypothetical protein
MARKNKQEDAVIPVQTEDPDISDGSEAEWAAVAWLEERLVRPRRLGEVIAEWCGGVLQGQKQGPPRWEGGRDGTNGHWVKDLNAARALLGVEAIIGTDDCWWWRLPAAAAKEAA